MTGSSSLSAIDSMTNQGVEILHVKSTNREVGGSEACEKGHHSYRNLHRLHLRQQIELVPGAQVDANGLPVGKEEQISNLSYIIVFIDGMTLVFG